MNLAAFDSVLIEAEEIPAMARKKAVSKPIGIVHASDIHFGSGESHGKINPETGLNIRFEDFVQALTKTVDFALANDADVFLFSGDAYRNASPEPIYQKMFARQLLRLSQAGIQTILLVGNHDQILRSTSSHSMSVFQSLAVPHVLTIDQPTVKRIETKSGPIQIVGLPHVTRNFMMANMENANLSPVDVERKLLDSVRELMTGMYEELDADIPTVTTAHMMVDQARAGAEQQLMVGYSLTFPTDIFIDDRVDYVALGHVHKYQVLRESKPAIVYAGSIERVDFGEEAEDKGFVHVTVERNSCTFEFHSITPRPFVTVDVDVTAASNIVDKICAAVKAKTIAGCVMRVRYRIRQEQLPALDERAVRNAAGDAMTVHLKPDVVVPQREMRMPEITEAAVASPIAALDTYLTQISPERKEKLMERAKDLCSRLNADDD